MRSCLEAWFAHCIPAFYLFPRSGDLPPCLMVFIYQKAACRDLAMTPPLLDIASTTAPFRRCCYQVQYGPCLPLLLCSAKASILFFFLLHSHLVCFGRGSSCLCQHPMQGLGAVLYGFLCPCSGSSCFPYGWFSHHNAGCHIGLARFPMHLYFVAARKILPDGATVQSIEGCHWMTADATGSHVAASRYAHLEAATGVRVHSGAAAAVRPHS